MRVLAWLVALLAALLPATAGAARLGNLMVFSGADQPLRAEIEVLATEDEYPSLSARLVHVEKFSSERSEAALLAAEARLTVERRDDGRPYVRVTSAKPLKEQFVDMFVEIAWAGGNRVHGYSFVLESPNVFQKPTAAPLPAAEASQKEEARPAAGGPGDAGAGEKKLPAPEAKPLPAGTPASGGSLPVAPAAAAEGAGNPAGGGSGEPARTHLVARGDTLGKIAADTKPEGVSLFQMLLALLRDNSHAFVDNNMNRLLAGALLSIPSKETAAAVDEEEARIAYRAQAAEYAAYVKRLSHLVPESRGAASAGDDSARPRLEVKREPADARDKLEISRAATDARPDGKASGPALEDVIVQEKGLKEANERIAQLEKNVADLKRLATMRETAGAAAKADAARNGALAAVAAPAAPVPPAPGFLEQHLSTLFAVGAMLALLAYLRYRAGKRSAAEGSFDSGDE